MELLISRKIVDSYHEKLRRCLDLDVAIVGAGPSGLICARHLARHQKKVAVFERLLKPGGGIWGGAMLFNEVVVEKQQVGLLEELGVRHSAVADGMVTCDSNELAAALIYSTVHAGATVLNGATVEDVVFQKDRVAGVVVNWSTVLDARLHVDPLVFRARCVLDATGHDAELCAKVARKAGVRLATETGGVLGERPMWAEKGEQGTVDSSRQVYPGLYVSGMAANGVFGAFRMGPIFGGMFRSGEKVANLMLAELNDRPGPRD